MKLKVWVELMTYTQMTESVVEVPDAEWNAMTPAERDEYKSQIFSDAQSQVASGGCEEMEEG